MRDLTATATTTALTLDDFVARLAARPLIEGILFVGSTATERMTPTSDYDLLVVFESLPAPLRLVTTWVDGRLTEVFCTTTQAIAHVGEAEGGFAENSEEGALLTWLRSGRIAFDRRGVLRDARAAALNAAPPTPPSDDAAYEAWYKIGYSVAQTKRYLAANDPNAHVAVEMRLLYSLADVMTGYFTVRRMPWKGEKAAIRYWTDQDPEFLARFRACLAETDCRRKVERYKEVARLALAPLGAPWTFGTTAIALGPGYGTGQQPSTESDPGEALAAWEALTAAI
jgi:hypothetical protein